MSQILFSYSLSLRGSRLKRVSIDEGIDLNLPRLSVANPKYHSSLVKTIKIDKYPNLCGLRFDSATHLDPI